MILLLIDVAVNVEGGAQNVDRSLIAELLKEIVALIKVAILDLKAVVEVVLTISGVVVTLKDLAGIIADLIVVRYLFYIFFWVFYIDIVFFSFFFVLDHHPSHIAHSIHPRCRCHHLHHHFHHYVCSFSSIQHAINFYSTFFFFQSLVISSLNSSYSCWNSS